MHTRPTDQTADPGAAPRALLLEDVHESAAAILRAEGLDVEVHATALDEDSLVEAVRGVHVLGVRSATRVGRRVLEAAPDLRAIGAFCTGTEKIDCDTAARRGVAVLNAPHDNARSVAEVAVGGIIALSRCLLVHNAAAHTGIWTKTAAGAHEVRGRRLGIVGYGTVGTQLSVLAEAIGMDVVFHDVLDRAPLGRARRRQDLDTLLGECDVVSLHVDGRKENRHLIGDGQLRAMRAGSLLLNLSRGTVLDTAALRRHLRSGHLAGAFIDVFPDEPAAPGQAFVSELQGLPNVLLTPHIGGSSQEAQQRIAETVATALVTHLGTPTRTGTDTADGARLAA